MIISTHCRLVTPYGDLDPVSISHLIIRSRKVSRPRDWDVRAYYPGSRKWLLRQAWCRRHPLQSRFSHRWAETHLYTCSTYIIWVFDQSLRYGTARLVDPQHTLWAQDGVFADTTTADSTGVLARFLEDIMVITRDQELGLLHVDTEPFTFHASLPCLVHPLGCPRWAPCHQHGTPVRNSRESASSSEYQNEEQWAKDRTLMHTNSHTKLLTVLTIDLHTTPGIGIHALDDTHSPFLNPKAP